MFKQADPDTADCSDVADVVEWLDFVEVWEIPDDWEMSDFSDSQSDSDSKTFLVFDLFFFLPFSVDCWNGSITSG